MISLINIIRTLLLRRRHRMELMNMDDRMLRDIGLSRTDAMRFAGLFKTNNSDKKIWENKNVR